MPLIYFITQSKRTRIILSFLSTWGRTLSATAKLLPYEKLVRRKRFQPGVYILTDFDRVSSRQLSLVRDIYKELERYPDRFVLLNTPGASLSRFEQLSRLHSKGHNAFRCVHATQLPADLKFPVFVRKGRGHGGKIGALVHDTKELEDAVDQLLSRKVKRDDVLVTEFVDTADENGVFKKYSAFILGANVVPRHIFFSRHWMIKEADLVNQQTIAEELDYLHNNPHREQLKEIFSLAGIQYGRIDYSLKEGQPVVWEINPSPLIASSLGLKKKERKVVHDVFARKFVAELKKIDSACRSGAIDNPLRGSAARRHEIKRLFPFNPAAYRSANLCCKVTSRLSYYYCSASARLSHKPTT